MHHDNAMRQTNGRHETCCVGPISRIFRDAFDSWVFNDLPRAVAQPLQRENRYKYREYRPKNLGFCFLDGAIESIVITNGVLAYKPAHVDMQMVAFGT